MLGLGSEVRVIVNVLRLNWLVRRGGFILMCFAPSLEEVGCGAPPAVLVRLVITIQLSAFGGLEE